VGLAEEKFGVKVQVPGTKESHARACKVTGLNQSGRTMPEQEPHFALSANSIEQKVIRIQVRRNPDELVFPAGER